MEARCLYFTVHSASNLVDVRTFKRMKVYAKVSIAGKSQRTEVDLVNETNPEWNKTFGFLLSELNIIQAQGKISVKVELFCKRSLSDDKYVGEVNLSLDSQCAKSHDTCSVERSDTNYKNSDLGTLIYSSVLGDKIIIADPSIQDFTDKVNLANIGATLVGVGATLVGAVVTIVCAI